jgi:hypothetical protein
VVVVVGASSPVRAAPPPEPAAAGGPVGPVVADVVGTGAGEVGAVVTAPSINGGRVTGTPAGTGDDVLAMGGCVVVVVSAGAPSGARRSPGRTSPPATGATSRTRLSGTTGPEAW